MQEVQKFSCTYSRVKRCIIRTLSQQWSFQCRFCGPTNAWWGASLTGLCARSDGPVTYICLAHWWPCVWGVTPLICPERFVRSHISASHPPFLSKHSAQWLIIRIHQSTIRPPCPDGMGQMLCSQHISHNCRTSKNKCPRMWLPSIVRQNRSFYSL